MSLTFGERFNETICVEILLSPFWKVRIEFGSNPILKSSLESSSSLMLRGMHLIAIERLLFGESEGMILDFVFF